MELSKEEAAAILDRINAALVGVGVVIEMRGKNRNLGLRGTFPPKPGSGKTKPAQTRVSLKMRGLTKADFKQVEIVARQVGLDLNTGEFDWRKWDNWDEPIERTTAHWIEEFEQWWWATHDYNFSSRNNWRNNYDSPFRKLPQDQPLTKELILNWVVSNTGPHQPRRSQYCRAGRALCKFAGIEIDLSEYDYHSTKAINPREIPSDKELLTFRESIEDPGWKFLFGLQIAYGFRNHEMLLVDYSSFPRLRVTRGKTGPRTVTPVLREWAIAWNLGEPVYPERLHFSCDERLDFLGKRITTGYRRLGLCTPYAVRHAFARRCIEQGLEPSLGAKLMGHSPQIHVKTYRAWVQEDVYLDTIERKLQGG